MTESELALPLLNENDVGGGDGDEEIIYQLLNTNKNDERRRSSRCSYFKPTRKRCVAISFALLLWFGFLSSLWTAASCKLVKIDYNKGGVELTIQAVGFWRYEQKVTLNNSGPQRDQSRWLLSRGYSSTGIFSRITIGCIYVNRCSNDMHSWSTSATRNTIRINDSWICWSINYHQILCTCRSVTNYGRNNSNGGNIFITILSPKIYIFRVWVTIMQSSLLSL